MKEVDIRPLIEKVKELLSEMSTKRHKYSTKNTPTEITICEKDDVVGRIRYSPDLSAVYVEAGGSTHNDKMKSIASKIEDAAGLPVVYFKGVLPKHPEYDPKEILYALRGVNLEVFPNEIYLVASEENLVTMGGGFDPIEATKPRELGKEAVSELEVYDRDQFPISFRKPVDVVVSKKEGLVKLYELTEDEQREFLGGLEEALKERKEK